VRAFTRKDLIEVQRGIGLTIGITPHVLQLNKEQRKHFSDLKDGLEKANLAIAKILENTTIDYYAGGKLK